MICLRFSKLLPLVPMVLGIMLISGQIIFLGWIHESLSDTFNGFMLFLSITWFASFHNICLNMTAILALSAA